MAAYTNKLINETSPYLLQHAHNPVDWYPWGEEALQKAKEEDKPILVSIGYAACHWCHVMERESFENPDTAAIMNEHFVNIKIDREERPDLDHIYMDAVQAMTGSGGWPLNVFLLPDGRPFYGGTYFPPVKAFNRSSWREVLQGVHQAYVQKKHELEAQATNLTDHLKQSNGFGVAKKSGGKDFFSRETLATIAQNILRNADTQWGGFGRAPKFPQTFSITYLLRHYHFTGDQAALDQALLSLDKMNAGGLYDQVGGGFARYSTDNEWLAPHFEKMLYDNALLLSALAEAYQLTKREDYALVMRQTIAFLEREMKDGAGGFWSALDADSEGEEGKYYTWQHEEIQALLGEDAAIFCAFFDVKPEGNWQHNAAHPAVTILFAQKGLEAFALEQGMDKQALRNLLDRCLAILLAHRQTRIRPQTDDKVLLGWNALLIKAFCKVYAALGDEHYRTLAVETIQFVESAFADGEGGWHHTWKNDVAKIPAFLDDLAYLVDAYIHVQEITGNAAYLTRAHALATQIIDLFGDSDTPFFFYTAENQSDVIIRKKEVYDGATPSGNAVMAQNLLYLALVFDQQAWRDRAMAMLDQLSQAIVKHPGSFGVWAMAVQWVIEEPLELVVVGKEALTAIHPILERYIPCKVFQLASETPAYGFPLLEGRWQEGKTSYFLCRQYSCQAPVNTLEAFLAIV